MPSMTKKTDPLKALPTDRHGRLADKPSLPENRQATEKITPSATEISVARNGSLKPYAICFQQLPDNIAREPMGLLAGAMTINDRSENSAYIVNFLASLAKKEYYGNPRRGAIESFEASLHKVNLGLAELAKEGNTEWIGTLNAAFCTIERNNLHFSVAGKAKVLLFRDHHLSDISDGLEDESDKHPMKTFTDVASGKISPGDRIIITTPELFSAISETEIERSVNRLFGEQFEQFLRTAAINSLDLCATVSITIETIPEYVRQPIAKPKRTLATLDSVPNAWSHAIFETSRQHGDGVEDSLKEKKDVIRDRVDDKTGHIYVTGETQSEETNETLERVRIFLADALRSLRRTGKIVAESFRSGIATGMRNLWNIFVRLATTIHRSFRSWRERRILRKTFEENKEETQTTHPPRRIVSLDISGEDILRIEEESGEKTTTNAVHVPIHEESSSRERATEYLRRTFALVATLAQKTFFFVWARSRKQKFLLLFTVILIIIFFFFFFHIHSPVSKEDLAQPTTQEPVQKTPFLSQDKNIHFLENTPVIMSLPDVVDIVHLKDTLFFITKDTLYSAEKNGGDAIHIALPDGAIATRATAMPDLNALLILTQDGKIYFFTPATHRFTEENAALPSTENIADIAAASTYLYVLDRSQNMIFRYPRAEGGFGVGTKWLKETTSIEAGTTFTVSDAIFIADTSGIHSYFRGARQGTSFELSTTPVSFTDLSTEIGSPSLFALDGANGRIVEYDATSGAILNQYASDSLKNATHFTVDSTSRTASVAVNNTILMAEMR